MGKIRAKIDVPHAPLLIKQYPNRKAISPTQIKGIINKTGTSVDRLVLVSLEALEAIHKDWKTGSKIPTKIMSNKNDYEDLLKIDLNHLQFSQLPLV